MIASLFSRRCESYIWCNSLGDSLFQTYVMNFVKFVIDNYLHITSHVSQAIASNTHYTSYSLMILCVILLYPSKIKSSLILMQNMFNVFFGKFDWKTCFWEVWVEFKCFWKTFHLILMHFIHKTMCFEEFLH